jgi:hypothetical protein
MTRRALARALTALGIASVLLLPAAAPVTAVDAEIDVTLALTPNAVSGSPFTFTPGYSDGFVPPSDAICSWEIAWGDYQSLHLHRYDETFGSVTLRGFARDGFCEPWTFTLPYSASGEWLYNFGITNAPGYWFETSSYVPGPDLPTFHGTNGVAPGSGVSASSIPGVWLSMPKGALIGDRVTVTAHPFGGYVMPPSGTLWSALSGACLCGEFAHVNSHSLAWTFTVGVTGTIAVFYNDKGEMDGTNFAGAGVDPSVKAVRRVTIRVNARVRVATATYVSAHAWLFHGTVRYVFYLDGKSRHVGPAWWMKFKTTGRHTLSVIATDRYGHRAKATQVVIVSP